VLIDLSLSLVLSHAPVIPTGGEEEIEGSPQVPSDIRVIGMCSELVGNPPQVSCMMQASYKRQEATCTSEAPTHKYRPLTCHVKVKMRLRHSLRAG
jgi:hypothetical protein